MTIFKRKRAFLPKIGEIYYINTFNYIGNVKIIGDLGEYMRCEPIKHNNSDIYHISKEAFRKENLIR